MSWWNPWAEVTAVRKQADLALRAQKAAETSLAEVTSAANAAQARADELEAANGDLQRQIAHAHARYDALTAPGAAPIGGSPEFVIVGIDRSPDAHGKRLIASRQLSKAEIGMDPDPLAAAAWKVTATMDATAFIDRPDYPTALAFLNTMWASADAERAAAERALPPPQQADIISASPLPPELTADEQATHPPDAAAGEDDLSVRKSGSGDSRSPRRPRRDRPPWERR